MKIKFKIALLILTLLVPNALAFQLTPSAKEKIKIKYSLSDSIINFFVDRDSLKNLGYAEYFSKDRYHIFYLLKNPDPRINYIIYTFAYRKPNWNRSDILIGITVNPFKKGVLKNFCEKNSFKKIDTNSNVYENKYYYFKKGIGDLNANDFPDELLEFTKDNTMSFTISPKGIDSVFIKTDDWKYFRHRSLLASLISKSWKKSFKKSLPSINYYEDPDSLIKLGYIEIINRDSTFFFYLKNNPGPEFEYIIYVYGMEGVNRPEQIDKILLGIMVHLKKSKSFSSFTKKNQFKPIDTLRNVYENKKFYMKRGVGCFDISEFPEEILDIIKDDTVLFTIHHNTFCYKNSLRDR